MPNRILFPACLVLVALAAAVGRAAQTAPGQTEPGRTSPTQVASSAQAPSGQTPSAQVLYTDVLAREQAVRAALADAEAQPAVLRAVRTVVADFERIVRLYPTSGYSDDALWHAGQLSLDAFKRFGEERERTSGVRLLQFLAAQYPRSRFARQVSAAVAEVTLPGAPDVSSAVAPPAAATVPALRRPAESTARTVPAPVLPAARPAAAPRVATIKDIRRVVMREAVRVTIELDAEVQFRDERLDSPARVFLDLPSTRPAPALVDRTIRFEGDGDMVRQIRIGRHPNNTTRVVLDVNGIATYSVYALLQTRTASSWSACASATPRRRPLHRQPSPGLSR